MPALTGTQGRIDMAGRPTSSPRRRKRFKTVVLILVTSAYADPEPISSFLRVTDYAARHSLTDSPANADAILFVENSRYHDDAFFARLRAHPLVRKYRERCFMYNEHDRPWCVLPGLYCSMPSRRFDSTRQAATRYIQLLNPVPTGVPGEPDILFSFMGNPKNSVRARLLKLRHPAAVVEDTRAYNAFSAEGVGTHHQRYADVLQRSKFVLCPRGAGTSSIRLFETLHAGRVPVIIADQWVAPEGPDWAEFSIRVREEQIEQIPSLLERFESEWRQMAFLARKTWATWFSDEVLFDRVGDSLSELLKRRRISESLAQRIPSISEWDWRLRRAYNRVSSSLRFASSGAAVQS
jgi:Exostosin family